MGRALSRMCRMCDARPIVCTLPRPGYHGMQTMNVSLTDNARKVLDQAQVEARQLNQEFVGTEHVLLALLHVSGTQAARILRQQHVDRDALRSQLLSVMPFSDTAPV